MSVVMALTEEGGQKEGDFSSYTPPSPYYYLFLQRFLSLPLPPQPFSCPTWCSTCNIFLEMPVPVVIACNALQRFLSLLFCRNGREEKRSTLSTKTLGSWAKTLHLLHEKKALSGASLVLLQRLSGKTLQWVGVFKGGGGSAQWLSA